MTCAFQNATAIFSSLGVSQGKELILAMDECFGTPAFAKMKHYRDIRNNELPNSRGKNPTDLALEG